MRDGRRNGKDKGEQRIAGENKSVLMYTWKNEQNSIISGSIVAFCKGATA